MHLYVYNGRHVVVSATEKPEEGTLSVKHVGVVDGIEGSKRRGRRPNFDQPVPVNKLTALESPSDELLKRATVALEGVDESKVEAPASEE